MTEELKGMQQKQPLLQNTKLPPWTKCSEQFQYDGCDKVFTWNFEDQFNCHTIVMV